MREPCHLDAGGAVREDRLVSTHEAVFARIHAQRAWGPAESSSGPGSGLARTAELRGVLEALLAELRLDTLLDAGCGDFHWLRAAQLPVRRYLGVEVVPALVVELERLYGDSVRRFIRADITREELPAADLVLCRDVLTHFPDEDVLRALPNLRRTGA